MGRGHGFRQAITFDVIKAGNHLELVRHRLGHRGAAAADRLEAGQVIAADIGIVHKVDRHRRDRAPARDPVPLYQGGGVGAVPADQDHDAAALDDRAVHDALHARHMEEGQGGQMNVLFAGRVPDQPAPCGFHHRAMAVHAALGLARRAGTVGDHRQVIGLRQMRAGLQPGRQRIFPAGQAGALNIGGIQRRKRLGQGDVAVRIGSRGIGRDQHPVQQACRDQRRTVAQTFLTADHQTRPCVAGQMVQFGAPAHRVDGHHHRIGAQGGEIADHEMRAVLHTQQHPVTLGDPRLGLHPARQPFHIGQQIGIGPFPAIEDQRLAVGKACGGFREIGEQRTVGRIERFRHPLGPDGIVACHHGHGCQTFMPGRFSEAVLPPSTGKACPVI